MFKWLAPAAIGGAITAAFTGLRDGLSLLSAFTGAGDKPTEINENVKQNDLFSSTTSSVRNLFVWLFDFAKVIKNLFSGDIPVSDIMSGKLPVTRAFSSEYERGLVKQQPGNANDGPLTALAKGAGNIAINYPVETATGLAATTALVSKATTGRWNPFGKSPKGGSGDSGNTPPDGNTPPKGPNGPANNSPDVRTRPLSESERIQEKMEAERVKAANAGKTADASQHDGQAAPKKAASGAAIETAENAVKHSKGSKLGTTIAALGTIGAVASLYPTQGSTDKANQSTDPALPNTSTREKIALGVMTAEAAYGASKGVSLAAKGTNLLAKESIKVAGKHLPGVGGILTMAFTAQASLGYALNGEWGRAGAELATGTVEAALNTTGLGLVGAGDVAREALRAGIGTVAGEGYAPEKSDLRTVYEYATGSGDYALTQTASIGELKNAAASTASVGELKDAVANSEIRTADVSLDDLSGGFTSNAMMPVPAPSGGGIDLSSMDNKNRKSRHPSPNATIG